MICLKWITTSLGMVNKMKAMKMKINNPDHSKAVQEWLFEQGYEWDDLSLDYPQFVEAPYLYTEDGSILYGDTAKGFVEDRSEEIDVSHLDPHIENNIRPKSWPKEQSKMIINYTTSDGQSFDSRETAYNHQHYLDQIADVESRLGRDWKYIERVLKDNFDVVETLYTNETCGDW